MHHSGEDAHRGADVHCIGRGSKMETLLYFPFYFAVTLKLLQRQNLLIKKNWSFLDWLLFSILSFIVITLIQGILKNIYKKLFAKLYIGLLHNLEELWYIIGGIMVQQGLKDYESLNVANCFTLT